MAPNSTDRKAFKKKAIATRTESSRLSDLFAVVVVVVAVTMPQILITSCPFFSVVTLLQQTTCIS